MKEQYGWPLSAANFTEDLLKFSDLIEYDGPLLSHYISKTLQKEYLFSWIDHNEQQNRWLVLEITPNHLYDYLSDVKSLAEIFQEPYNSKVIILSTDVEGVCSDALLVPSELLRPEYKPQPISYYDFAMPEEYDEYFARTRAITSYAGHLHNLRTEAVRFRLAPLEARFASTIGATDIGGFLQRLTRSFKSYVEVRFLAQFREEYSLLEYALTDLSKVLKMIEPRSVYNQFGSFEIDLAIDVLPSDIKFEIATWQIHLLQEFRYDVFDFNFSSAQHRPNSLAGASEDEMRAIFLPIIQIANNQNYYVETKPDKRHPYRRLNRVSNADARRIAPPRQNQENDAVFRTELTNILLELREGQDIATISLRQLRDAMLAVTTGDQTSISISSFRPAEGPSINFTEPIEVSISRVGNLYQAAYTPLDIAVLGANARAAMDAFNNQIRTLFARLQINSEERLQGSGLRTEKEGRILDALADLLG